ncbi:hypothetical protein Tco_0537338 [Tanacetum coccineum]
MDTIPPRFADVLEFLIIIKGLFKKKSSTVPQIIEVIASIVRLKLVTFKFKKVSTRARILLDKWKIPSSSLILEGSTSYGESWKARMQGGSVEEGLCGDFVAMAYFRQQRGDVVHLVSKDSKEVLVSSLEEK